MSSCDRRQALTLLAALPLAACGFTPAYGPGGAARDLLDAVTTDDPTDKNAFDLVERVEERLGRTPAPRYRLSYRIETTETDLGITTVNAITRYNVSGSVSFALTAVTSGALAAQGRVRTFTAYAASGTTVATDASRADAYTRLMRLLADQMVTALVAAVGSNAPGAPG